MRVLIAYDVADPRRLRRMAKVAERFGARVQRSVFECEVREDDLARLLDELRAAAAPHEDRVHVYRLCGACATRGSAPPAPVSNIRVV